MSQLSGQYSISEKGKDKKQIEKKLNTYTGERARPYECSHYEKGFILIIQQIFREGHINVLSVKIFNRFFIILEVISGYPQGIKHISATIVPNVFYREIILKDIRELILQRNLFNAASVNSVFKIKLFFKCYMKIHTGENPYQCIHCSNCFLQRHNLNRHMRTHTGE